MQIDLRGKVAVVTGGSGELGRVMARTLAGCGADIALTYLKNREMAEEVRAQCEKLGVRAIAVQADVTECASVQALQKEVTAKIGDAHIIVNNAVIQYKWLAVLEQNPEDFESQFRSCVLHNLHMAQAFVPGMVKRNSGRIVAISTECAMQNAPSQGAYVSGKRGMDGLLRVLAREVGSHQITVNQVAPGWTVSERDRSAGTEQNENYAKNVPLKRRGTDQEIANVVAFLASDLASFVTGVYIPVSGGSVMPGI